MRATRFVIIALLLAIATAGPAWSQGRVTVGQQVLYGFAEGSGATVADVSGVGTPLNLTIADPQAVTWIPGGGLTLDAATRISSGAPATKLISAVMATHAITVEAWVTPANATQDGPARIVTVSADAYGRNVTLGQGSYAVGSDLYSVRLRTTTSGLNGVPDLNTPVGSLATALTHVVYTRDAGGTTRLYLDGALVQTGTNGGDLSNWNAAYALGLGNEFVDDRPWLGTFHLVAVFDRALAGVEVAQNFAAGPYLTPQPPTIVVHPADATVHPGQSAEFSVVAAGSGPLSYRWQRNQADIPDAASSSFNTGPTVLADDGARFRTVVTNDQGQAISNEAVLNVQEFGGVVRVMPCGDSITNGGAGASDDAGYRRSLYLQLTAAGHAVDFVGTMSTGIPVDFDRDHEGHDGWRADQIRDNIYNWLTLNPADIVLLHIGTNDISGGNQSVQEVVDILENIDQWEADNAAPITVVLARIILRLDGLNPQTIAFNDAVEAMALARIAGGDDIVLVDQENTLTYPGDMADSLHPNDAGYGKMADTWFAALGAILPTSGISTVSNVTLAASSPGQLTSDDLTCTYTLNGDAVTAATAWTRNGVPEMAFYLPMEGGEPGALLDRSGHGTVVGKVGNPTWNAGAGRDGYGAYVFDGSDGLGAGAGFPVNSSYTKCAWVYRTGSGANGGNNIISGSQDAGGHAFWAPDFKNNRLGAAHAGPTWLGVEDSVPLALNTWYFVAVTWDDATDLMILYKDGVEVDRATVADSVTDPSLYVGTFGTLGWQWLGTIDDPRVYAHALAPEQIAALFSTGRDVVTAPETEVGDQWQAQVTPFSSAAAGATVPSNSLTILSGTPLLVENLVLASTSGNNFTSDDLTASYALAGDATTAATAWIRNGAPFLALYYPFEGGAGNALTDHSGSGHQGTAYGDPAWLADAGHDGRGGLVLDGDDYVDAGNCMSTGAYTKSAWVYWIDNAATLNNILSGQSDHALWIANYDGSERLTAGHHEVWNSVADPEPFVPQVWTFVAVTYDPAVAGGTMTLYKNGVAVDAAAGITPTTNTRAFIGAYAGLFPMQGSIDDARIYHRALSPAQIGALYAGGNLIVAAETAVGDTWQAAVTPFSATEAGVAALSNTITIVSEFPPLAETVNLVSASGNDLTADDLTVNYVLAGSATTAATAWIRNGVPEMALYLPMEGAEPAALLDHSGHGLVVGKVGNPVWTYGAGHDGHGAYVFAGGDGLGAGESFPVNSSYTKCAWVYRTGSGANGGNNIISGDQNEGGHAFWAPDAKSNHLAAGHAGPAWLGVEDSVPLALNTWYFVAVTWNDATDLMILYKDGVEVDRATVANSVTDPSLYVGTFGADGWRWRGTIDDPRVYAHALAPEQIAALFSTGRDIVTAAETEVGDQWQARVTPFSATETGATVPSNILTILPGATTRVENLELVSASGNNLTTDDLTCNYDLAGDAVTAATAWTRDGVPEMSAYLPMEGGATNALHDYSGGGHHGSPVSDPNWAATGGPDAHGCFEFDGNDYIGLGSPMPAGGAYTKAVWVYWTPGAFLNNILSGSSGHALWVTSYPEGNAASPLTDYYLSAGHNDPWRAVKDTTSFPAGQWVHVAVSYDPAADGGTMILYRDGVEVDRATGIAPSVDTQAFLGAFAGLYPIQGSMDDARIYLHALTAAQVAALHATGRDIIADEETSVGETWQAYVTAFSATGAGEPQASNVLTIVDPPSGVDEPARPAGYALHGCVPNPFNPLTVIGYELPVAAPVSLRVFDISGRLIAVLKDGASEPAGRHEVAWTGRDRAGQQVAAGVYFYRMEAGSFAQTRRMVLVK